ncbi:hypothetical protein [Cytophaga sp. FL35]|uniref:hypothetical protein n=1 Tax=Cytophaga sp. FL35 TaxID=1904456 RepID=UPI0016539602|nr:hypothetical protein [Cytophaga sp. FL35]MBC6999724.1 hypothetical protein [Cytophaga sp. FL35]
MNTPSFIGFLLSILGIAALLFWGRNIQNPYWKCIWRSGLLFCSLYALILLILAINAQYINLQMEAMDLDSNGKIDLTEYTPEYRELRNQLLKDPERNNAFLNAALLSLLMAGIALGMDTFTTFLKSKTDRIRI